MAKKYSLLKEPSLKDAGKRIGCKTVHFSYSLDEKYKGLGQGKTYLIKTYGCQGNLADSEKLAGILEELGFKKVYEESDADLIIFNTCAIRENAENRVFGELGRIKNLKTENPNLVFAFCGCMSQEEKVIKRIEEKYPQVDIVFGTHNIHMLAEYLYSNYQNKKRIIEVFSEEGNIVEDVPVRREHNKKAWVNIMYGCDEFCTYCIVPYTRGKERSRNPEAIIKEVKELISEGFEEVTLLGQNVNAYGKDLDINYTFSNLLDDLNKLPISRIRFTTSHPRDLDEETIKVMAKGGNIMPHLHLPVQSGSNTVLKKMNRKYTKEEYLSKIDLMKKLIPGIAITTDIIVGFPGETKEDFEETIDLVKKADFEGAYTFIFSPRNGTPASKMIDNTPDEEKKARLLALNEIINEGYKRGNLRFEGKTVDVLVEGPSDKGEGILMGYTPHNKLVNFKGDISLVGKIIPVYIEKAYSWHLKGTLEKK